MPNQNESHQDSIVELAMARASKHKAQSESPLPEPVIAEPSPGRRDYDVALSRRLHPRPAASSEGAATQPEAPPRTEAISATASGGKPRHSLRIASHFLSATTGAAVMWAVMGEPIAPPKSAPPAAAAAVAEVVPLPPESSPVAASVAASVATPVAASVVVPVETQIRDTLEHWRRSWSDRDINTYLSFYSADFVPADGTRRSAWADGRRKNLLSRSSISVEIHDVKILPLDHNQVKVVLLQDYASGRYKETRQPKTFLLAQEGSDWRILGEWEGDRSLLKTSLN